MVNLSNSIHPFKEIHLSLRIFGVKWKSCSSKAIKGERENQQVSLFAVKVVSDGFYLTNNTDLSRVDKSHSCEGPRGSRHESGKELGMHHCKALQLYNH